MVKYLTVSANDLSRWHQFGSKVLPGISVTHYSGVNLERRHYGRRHWRIGGDGRNRTPRPKAQCKGSVDAAKKWKLHISNRTWNSQKLWERTASENIHLNQGSPGTRRTRWITFAKPSSRWLNRRYQNNKCITGCLIGEKYWRLLERGWRKIICCMYRIQKVRSTEGKATRRTHMVREETCEETNNLSEMEAKKKAKRRWAIEKPKFDNARHLRGMFFIEPNDEEFTFRMKAVRRKLEVPMTAAMHCKIPLKSSGETHRTIGKRKTKCVCVVDTDECTGPRLPHQDHIIVRGMNSFAHCSLVHKFIPMPQAF